MYFRRLKVKLHRRKHVLILSRFGKASIIVNRKAEEGKKMIQIANIMRRIIKKKHFCLFETKLVRK